MLVSSANSGSAKPMMAKAENIFVIGLFGLAVFMAGCRTTRSLPSREEPSGSNRANTAVDLMDATGAILANPFVMGTNSYDAPRLSQSETNTLPVSAFAENEAPQLSPGLVVTVSVLVSGKKEIDEPAKRISNSGEISLPLIGNVQANGLSLDELVAKLTKLYNDYFIQPQVVIEFVKDQNSDMVSPWGYVTVLGRVKNPGRVSIPPTQDMTISGAIQKAGGLDTSAKDSAIKITRQLPGGKSAQYEVDLRSVGSRGRVHDDLILKPGDVVFVSEMMF